MIIGIDLGTTNSAAAVWRNGRAELIPNALGDFLTPSAISFTEEHDILVGAVARDRQSTHPRETVTAFKRRMGTQQTVTIDGSTYSAEDLSSFVLRRLKEDAESYLGESITGAVVTVPAYFNERQRRATRRAGELAGLNVERLLNEPTAAALAFGVNDRAEREPFLVFDLGGGTFDVSIVEVFEGIVEVRASAGDNRLGGEDFNSALIDLARTRIDPSGELAGADPILLQELLRAAAERTKRRLSDAGSAPFTLTWRDRSYATEISVGDFDRQIEPLIDRLREPVLRSLRDSGIRVEALSEVVLVGGATRMPAIRRAITRMFGRFPNTTIHPDHAVALGAAVQAGLLSRDAALDEIRLTDVCPFTLGVDHMERDARGVLRGGLFSPIIDRNTVIPVSRVNRYNTVSDNQRVVQFGIYQGEARDVTGNVKLGEVQVPVPPRPAGHITVECRFSYDTSGLLEVDVHVPETGLSKNLVITDDADSLSPEALAERRATLAALKLHPRDLSENSALVARAQRCYESFLAENRQAVGQAILEFEGALETQNPRVIRDARVRLTETLNALEGDRYL